MPMTDISAGGFTVTRIRFDGDGNGGVQLAVPLTFPGPTGILGAWCACWPPRVGDTIKTFKGGYG